MPKSDDLKYRLDELFTEFNAQEHVELAQPKDSELIPGNQLLEVFQVAYGKLPEGICVTSLEGRFIRVNNSLAALLGYDPDELMDKSLQEVTYPDDRYLCSDALDTILAGEKEHATFQMRSICKGGEIIWVELGLSLLRNAVGGPMQFVIFMRDVHNQKRIEVELSQRTQALEIVNQAMQRINQTLDFQEILADMLEQAILHSGYEAGLISYHDAELGRLKLLEHRNLPDVIYKRLVDYGFSNTPCELVYQLGRIVYAQDVYNLPDDISEWEYVFDGVKRLGFKSYFGIPFISNRKVFGTLCMFSYSEQEVNDIQKKVLEAISQQVSLGYERTQQYKQVEVSLIETKIIQERLAKRAAEMETVAEVSTVVATMLDPEQFLQAVVDLTKERFGVYHTHIYLRNPESESLVLAAGAGEPGRQMVEEGWEIPIGREQSLVARAARGRYGIIVNDVRSDKGFLANKLLPHTAAEMAVPLLVGDELLGVMDVQSDQVGDFTEDDLTIYTTLANQVAVGLQNARQFEQRLNSERLVRMIIDSTPDWIFTKDRKHRFTLVNQSYANSLGLQPADMLGKVEIEIGFPEEVVKGNPDKGIRGFWQDEQRVLDLGEALSINGEVNEINGELHYFDIFKAPLIDREKNIFGLLGVVRDITDRQLILAEAQALYEGSAQVVKASSLEEVLAALVESTALQQLEQANLVFFDRPWSSEKPKSMVMAAAWGKREGASRLPLGVPYEYNRDPFFSVFRSRKLSFVSDATTDQRFDEKALAVISSLGMKGAISVPLLVGDLWFGMVIGYSSQTLSINDEDVRRIISLGDQAATVIQSMRLQEDMQNRVRELTALQRLMSREAWAAYQVRSQDNTFGYMFDQAMTQPIDSSVLSYSAGGNGSNNHKEAASRMQIPLSVRGQPIGILGVQQDLQQELSHEDVAFLQAISEQVSQAMERARLMEQTQKAAMELQAVAEVSTATSTLLNPVILLQSVVDLTRRSFGLYHAHIYLLDEHSENLVLTVGSGDVGRKMTKEGWYIPLAEPNSIVAIAARSRQGQIVNDIRQGSSFLPNPLLPETKAELAVPLIVGNNLLGVFDVQADTENRFTDEDLRTYSTLAAQTAVALQNAKLYEEQLETVERLRELDNMKSAFLANMSHELRTPLNSILGFTQVILEELDGPLTDMMIADLELIEKNGKHLLGLINDVLDMAKIEAGRFTLSPEALNLYDLLEEVIISSSSLAREKDLYIYLESEPSELWTVTADSVRIRQIFINLIGNSIKFTDYGGIKVELERLWGAADGKEDRIQVRVIDTGIGIPSDKLDSIFEAFSQVDNSTTRKAGGTGLGLPISRRLVELHGGRLWAESTGEAGDGSIFYMELPITHYFDTRDEIVGK